MPTRARLLLTGRANTTDWPRLGAGRGEGRDTHPARRRRVTCLAALVLMLEGTDRLGIIRQTMQTLLCLVKPAAWADICQMPT